MAEAPGAASGAPSAGRHFAAEVAENARVSRGHFLLSFRQTENAPRPAPGQFYMVGVPGIKDPLLKRPFCFFRKRNESIQILYRVRGKATSLLSRMGPGDPLDVIGPLGNSWPAPKGKHIPLVVAGGIGMASVFPLIAALDGKAAVVYGGRNRDELLVLDELRPMCLSLSLTTEDGSVGARGTVMDALRSLDVEENHLVYACGPRGMLKAVAEWAGGKGIKGYASLEERMACGVGACLGCAVKTKKGIKEVCIDGPVFGLDEVEWEY